MTCAGDVQRFDDDVATAVSAIADLEKLLEGDDGPPNSWRRTQYRRQFKAMKTRLHTMADHYAASCDTPSDVGGPTGSEPPPDPPPGTAETDVGEAVNTEEPPSGEEPCEDPLFQMIGVDDVEPADVDDVVYGETGATADEPDPPGGRA